MQRVKKRSRRAAVLSLVALAALSAFGVFDGPAHGGGASIKIPVLLYHRIDDDPGHLSISEAALDGEMSWLQANGYTAITPDDLERAISGEVPLPSRPVVLTVDDGYRSALVFHDVLHRHSFRGVYFWPNWAELTPAEMVNVAEDGEICGHTYDHKDLTTLSLAQQEHEILDNQHWLQRMTGQPVTCFAYPMGRSNADSITALAEGQFALAFDASGPESTASSLDVFHVARKAINRDVSLEQFIALMTVGW